MKRPFTYNLPENRIAERPVRPYDEARMLVMSVSGGRLSDSRFADLPDYLSSGDLLVFNNTKVLRARLRGTFEPGGGKAELLLLSEIGEGRWRALGKPLEKFKPGRKVRFSNELSATIVERGARDCVVTVDAPQEIDRVGMMPIPPYIRRGESDEADDLDYQSPFSKEPGSVAAPTASLHFTPNLLERLVSNGVGTEFLTLHLGTASFLPVLDENGALVPPGEESFRVEQKVLDRIKSVRASGGKVIAVGTSAVRALESAAADGSDFTPTSLFITPGYKFKNLDGIITNFHQPGTTHLLLVEAFLGADLLDRAYGHALHEGYRFLSYGDGMLLLP